MKPILIQGAHLPEVQKLVDRLLLGFVEEDVDGFKFWVGHLQPGSDPLPVVISLTGIGLSLAAASVVVARQRYDPVAIINQGIAGGHTADGRVGDIVVGTYCINMNAFKTPYAARGDGSDSLKWKPKRSRGAGGGHEEIPDGEDLSYVDRKRLRADPGLLRAGAQAAAGIGDGRKILFGGVGTSETWNSEIDRIEYLHGLFGTLCEEMEAAAVAQIAQLFSIPFVSIRIISNNITREDGAYDLSTAQACQDFVVRVCDLWHASGGCAQLPSDVAH